MRKTILTILGSALLAASPGEFRNSMPAPSVEPGWSRYENGAMSAPAGR